MISSERKNIEKESALYMELTETQPKLSPRYALPSPSLHTKSITPQKKPSKPPQCPMAVLLFPSLTFVVITRFFTFCPKIFGYLLKLNYLCNRE